MLKLTSAAFSISITYETQKQQQNKDNYAVYSQVFKKTITTYMTYITTWCSLNRTLTWLTGQHEWQHYNKEIKMNQIFFIWHIRAITEENSVPHISQCVLMSQAHLILRLFMMSVKSGYLMWSHTVIELYRLTPTTQQSILKPSSEEYMTAFRYITEINIKILNIKMLQAPGKMTTNAFYSLNIQSRQINHR